MCGIWAALLKHAVDTALFITLQDTMQHRGPDQTRRGSHDNFHYCFHRLAIMDPTPGGMQPFETADVIVMCNGELYNYLQLIKEYQLSVVSHSDCEILAPLYQHFGGGLEAVRQICLALDGEYAFVIYDKSTKLLYHARDAGIRPLWYTETADGVFFASTMLSLTGLGGEVRQHPPHSYGVGGVFHQYYSLRGIPTIVVSYAQAQLMVRDALRAAVRARVHADRPIGAFLSGGLDSSLIVALMCEVLPPASIRTFAIGLRGSLDLAAAARVADYLGTQHTSVEVDFETAFAEIPATIKYLETYDTTSVRATVFQKLLARHISEHSDIKVVLSGEGSDELAFGYRMWYKAPSREAAQEASVTLCEQLCYYDNRRGDSSTSAASLELRVPFLQRDYMSLLLSLPAKYKMPHNGLEKHLLRDAFVGLLPLDILYRGKEAFSDGVGHQWVEGIKARVADLDFRQVVGGVLPRTPEERYYRSLFDQYFPGQAASLPAFWSQWWVGLVDPSAREVAGYVKN